MENKIKLQREELDIMQYQISEGIKVLSNGAIELLRKQTDNVNVDIVLALHEDMFVVWYHYKNNEMYGHGEYYSKDLQRALNDYNKLE